MRCGGDEGMPIDVVPKGVVVQASFSSLHISTPHSSTTKRVVMLEAIVYVSCAHLPLHFKLNSGIDF